MLFFWAFCFGAGVWIVSSTTVHAHGPVVEQASYVISVAQDDQRAHSGSEKCHSNSLCQVSLLECTTRSDMFNSDGRVVHQISDQKLMNVAFLTFDPPPPRPLS
jgi:hypothetical protein